MNATPQQNVLRMTWKIALVLVEALIAVCVLAHGVRSFLGLNKPPFRWNLAESPPHLRGLHMDIRPLSDAQDRAFRQTLQRLCDQCDFAQWQANTVCDPNDFVGRPLDLRLCQALASRDGWLAVQECTAFVLTTTVPHDQALRCLDGTASDAEVAQWEPILTQRLDELRAMFISALRERLRATR